MYESSMRDASNLVANADQRHSLDVQLCQQSVMRVDLAIKTSIEEIERLSNASQRDLSLMTKLVNDTLHEFDALLDQFHSLIQRVRREEERSELATEEAEHRRALERNRSKLRAATLTAMQRMGSESRASLLSSSRGPTEVHRRGVRVGGMREEASSVTNSLTTLLARMNEQVVQSETTLSTLVDSSNVIKATEKEMGMMGAEIETSGKLLNRYDRRELTDRLLIAVALLLFVLVVAYILLKRSFGHVHWSL